MSTLGLALRKDEYTHILIILPVSAALTYLEWGSGHAQPEANFRGDSVLMLLAVLAGLVGSRWLGPANLSPDLKLSLSMLTLVIWWIGSFVFCFGTRIALRFLFPLCFLFWLVPVPEQVLSKIVAFWQQGSATCASVLFSVWGVPVTQDGIRLSIPGLSLEVAQECSSLRSSLILVVTSMVLAQLLLHSVWQKAAVVLIAVPLSIAKNGFRIFTIAMLGTRIDPGYLTGRLHRNGGIIFFSIALAIEFLLIWVLMPSDGVRRVQHS